MSEYFVKQEEMPTCAQYEGGVNSRSAPSHEGAHIGIVGEDDLVGAHEYLMKLPQIERSALDGLVDRHATVYEILASDDLPRRNDALFAVIASGFAAAPAHSAEALDPPAWKRVLGGAARGARATAHAVAITTPGRIHRQYMDEELINSVIERRHLLLRRKVVLDRHAELNDRKRRILEDIDNDYASIESLELERDERLQQVKAKEAAFVQTLMETNLLQPEVHAHASVICNHFEKQKCAIHDDFKQNYPSRATAEEKARLLEIIDSELERLHKRGLC